MEIPVLHRLPFPDKCRRMVEKFAFEPHPIATLIKKLRFDYSCESYMSCEDFFEPPALIVGGTGIVRLTCKPWPPKYVRETPMYHEPTDTYFTLSFLSFPYDERTGNYIDPATYRGDPNDYDIDDSASEATEDE